MKSFVLGVVQWLWTSFAQLMRLICQDVSKMANDMAKLAEVAEVSGAQVQEVRFLEKSLFETASSVKQRNHQGRCLKPKAPVLWTYMLRYVEMFVLPGRRMPV